MLGDFSNTSSAAAAESRDACRANDDCVEERIDMPTKTTLNMYEYEGDVRVVCGDANIYAGVHVAQNRRVNIGASTPVSTMVDSTNNAHCSLFPHTNILH